MKSSLKSKISHFFKGKPSKLEKYPTYDQSYKVKNEVRNIENEDARSIQSDRGKIQINKKAHKKPKNNLTLNLLETKVKNISEFPVLSSPMTDQNESSKLTAQEFAKAVGIKILHKTDEEEDEECDCEYCRNAHTSLNIVSNIDSSCDDNMSATPTQQISNDALNQYSLNSPLSSNNNTIGAGNINIPPFPAFNFSSSNENLQKCSSNASINSTTSNNFNHIITNSKTIGTPGYHCHRSRKNSISKVVNMSLFIPPTEQELKSRVQSSSLSINSTPESSSSLIQAGPSNEKIIGGSLDRNKNLGRKKNYYGVISPNRDRSASASIAAVNRPRILTNMNDYKTSPILRDSSVGYSSRIQFKQAYRCDSNAEISNTNASNINPSSPNKRPYPPSLASSSSSSTTLSPALSLTHISQPNLNSIASSQSSSQSINYRPQENHPSQHLNNYSPRPGTPVNSVRSPMSSSCSSITPIKPHSSFKITRSVTISEGGRHSEIDIKPLEKEEVMVYQKGRFTITCEHSRRPSVSSFQAN
ncbi:hypothetical protein BCR36DRAFT_581386 [Piromyces finnis]|uniref:Uncharacterized protein n=1 Tax=Piromyces finnis TaxID=1754191 RepID=A0A1Y1VG04_9FUNG|nr:hypothetical protein BCR36DRAFT_581386 [Piromyces finnis]|eukprot:ORX55354.1 hypothetical protein BCR36DRAFT_581386 [Piromyces finnis]